MNNLQNIIVQKLSGAMAPKVETENGAIAKGTIGSAVLDLFALLPAMRSNVVSDEFQSINELLENAYLENPELAAKIVFYTRDIRNGQGERAVFRHAMKQLISLDARFKQLIKFIPEFGRWDDVVYLFDVASKEVVQLIKDQLKKDLQSKHPSLLGKWLPSENTSSVNTRKMAYKIMNALNMTPKQYRKMLVILRQKIWIVENDMRKNKWKQIPFEKVPGNAMHLYQNAFLKHAPIEFNKYIFGVKNGSAKINAKTLMPYQIVRSCLNPYISRESIEVMDTLWKNLPDYYQNNPENALVVCDVSGSMQGLPIQVAISLSIYIAEKNKGIWQNRFITFSTNPVMQIIKGKNIFEKVQNLQDSDWGMNTDIEKVFDIILKTAVKNKVVPSEMIKRLYIVSDMEFDNAMIADVDKTLFEQIEEKYNKYGYEMPELVFWNVDARNKQFPMSMDSRGFLNVAGFNPSILEYLLKHEMQDPYQLMMEVLGSERYSMIKMDK